MTLAQLDTAAPTAAAAALERCCGARAWVEAMVAARPFGSREALHALADRAAATLREGDWREAFAHHPRIGDAGAAGGKLAATAAWAGREQTGAASAPEATRNALAEGNRAYEARFGHVFIVCATGLSADEMLARLHARMGNDAEEELRVAAAEQLRITHLRLDKLLEEVT